MVEIATSTFYFLTFYLIKQNFILLSHNVLPKPRICSYLRSFRKIHINLTIKTYVEALYVHQIESFENLHEALIDTTIPIHQPNYSKHISKHNMHNKIGPRIKHQNHYTYKEIYSRRTPKLKPISSPCTHFADLAQNETHSVDWWR